jgi:hypothetical protein
MMMTMSKRVMGLLVALVCGSAVGARAQTPTPKPPDQMIKVDLVLSRSLGDKRVSNMPFTLWINAPGDGSSGGANLRVGIDVPIGSTTTQSNTNAGGTTQTTTRATTQTEYRNVGTSIDASAALPQPDGRYRVRVNVYDTSVFDPTGQAGPDASGRATGQAVAVRAVDATAFRTLSFSNTLPMRDGQSLEFASATDKVTGETVRLMVTITVMK